MSNAVDTLGISTGHSSAHSGAQGAKGPRSGSVSGPEPWFSDFIVSDMVAGPPAFPFLALLHSLMKLGSHTAPTTAPFLLQWFGTLVISCPGSQATVPLGHLLKYIHVWRPKELCALGKAWECALLG